jgi:hypothetical protein
MLILSFHLVSVGKSPINKPIYLGLGANATTDIGLLAALFSFEGLFTSIGDYFVSWAHHAVFGNQNFLQEQLTDDDEQPRR